MTAEQIIAAFREVYQDANERQFADDITFERGWYCFRSAGRKAAYRRLRQSGMENAIAGMRRAQAQTAKRRAAILEGRVQ